MQGSAEDESGRWALAAGNKKMMLDTGRLPLLSNAIRLHVE